MNAQYRRLMTPRTKKKTAMARKTTRQARLSCAEARERKRLARRSSGNAITANTPAIMMQMTPRNQMTALFLNKPSFVYRTVPILYANQ